MSIELTLLRNYNSLVRKRTWNKLIYTSFRGFREMAYAHNREPLFYLYSRSEKISNIKYNE